MIPAEFLAFVLAALLIELTPGPNMGYLAVVTLRQGKRAGFAVVAGVTVGLLVLGLAGAWGVSQNLKDNDFAYQLLRYAGIGFMFYLAWEGWRGDTGKSQDQRGNFLRGFLNNVLNPKAALFYVAVLTKFTDPTLPIFEQTVVLTLTHVFIATVVHVAIVLGASAFSRFAADARREKFIRRFLSLSLAAFALWFAWSTAR